jgi:hypothetical protein
MDLVCDDVVEVMRVQDKKNKFNHAQGKQHRT